MLTIDRDTEILMKAAFPSSFHGLSPWVVSMAFCLLLLMNAPSAAGGDEVNLVLTESVTFSTDNWYPLSESEITSAVADSALSVLTQGAYLRIADGANTAGNGRIAFSVSLIGPAEVAKATISIDSPRTGSLVSTASVSLAGMNHQGIFHAFEHVGSEAASRMIAQVASRLDQKPIAAKTTNSELQKQFENAAALKRQAEFDTAKKVFLEITQHEGTQAGNWPELAADEIRYGLPMYHAKYLLTGGGRFSVDPAHALSNLDVAENLLRQVYAENAGSIQRVQEAQSLLDGIQIGRNSMQRAAQANWLAQISPLKMMLTEMVMTEGACPDSAQLAEIAPHLSKDVKIEQISDNGDVRTYHLQGPQKDLNAKLDCDSKNYSRPVQLRTE